MLSLTEITADLKAGRLSTTEGLDHSFDAIDRHEAAIGAFEAIADRGAVAAGKSGPLSGIAIGVKDIFDTADLPTTYGSPIYHDHRPRADAAIVAMARNAGATIIGKTVTAEFAFFHPGKTRNPHSLEHSPGGSSSGSAAAVAAGMIPVAIGTQTGGSIIRPASFCGVVGYKPSFRLMPVTGMKPFSWSLDTAGLFAATVADVGLFAELLTGRPLRVEAGNRRPLRIGFYRTSVWEEANPEMRDAVGSAALTAQQAGATVVEVAEPQILADARDIHTTIQDFEGALALSGELHLYRSQLSEKLVETLESGRLIDPAGYDAARSIARRARKTATALFEDIDVLLTPSAPGIAPEGHDTTGEPTFNKLWTLTGNPCLNVPATANVSGLPLGVQIVGRFGRDQQAIQAASWLETVLRS